MSLAMLPALLLVASAASAVCTPTVLWTWDGDARQPDAPGVCSTPLVVQLTDDNSDGRIDSRDDADVAFIAGGPGVVSFVTVVDGATGAGIFTNRSQPVRFSSLAAGDIDGDGVVELLAMAFASDQVVAFEHDGSTKWLSDVLPIAAQPNDGISIADIDQDGNPEIYVGATVFDNGGRLRWHGTAGQGSYRGWRRSNAVDLRTDVAGLELLAGHTLYGATGGILWNNAAVPDGWTGVADLDQDGDGEVVLVAWPKVYVLDHLGVALGTPSTVTGLGNFLSQPAMADLDGDGYPEVIIGSEGTIEVLSWTGTGFTSRWRETAVDTGYDSPSAFDFDGDGAAEVLHHDEVAWNIRDGVTGAIVSSIPFASGTGVESPVVADIDGDGAAEILITGCRTGFGWNAVVAYGCCPVAGARAIWNQHQYHVTNVNDDGTIPRFEVAPWSANRGWSVQRAGPVLGGGPVADAGPPATICAGDGAILDGSGSTPCPGATLEYRWLEGGAVVTGCDWSPTPTCGVMPATTTVYTLEVRCVPAGCAGPGTSATVVSVEPDLRPAGLGNTIRAVRLAGDVRMSWAATPYARSYNLYRGIVKSAWPASPHLTSLGGTTASLPDVAPVPSALYFYRTTGRSCSGLEGP